jgi:hypothetical protein
MPPTVAARRSARRGWARRAHACAPIGNALYDRLGLPEETNERVSAEIAELIGTLVR